MTIHTYPSEEMIANKKLKTRLDGAISKAFTEAIEDSVFAKLNDVNYPPEKWTLQETQIYDLLTDVEVRLKGRIEKIVKV